jgi:hypothetical protein
MIAMVKTGKSFSHCIGYCLEDKRELSQEQKLNLMNRDGLQHHNRAEVLYYNQCFGNRKDLASQFKDVSKLSKRVEKPVLHVAIRLAPNESLSREHWIEVAQKAAQELGVDNNQYLVIQHRDTKEEHIHIVANRVGFDGKAASTSNNFYKMDRLLRDLEKQYQLEQVLSPKQFLPKEQQQLSRMDRRKEQMKADIKDCLKQSVSYSQFEQQMKELGYSIIRSRGISFIDDKKVEVKGSELGFSLMKIEKALAINLQNQLIQERKFAVQQKAVDNIKSHKSYLDRRKEIFKSLKQSNKVEYKSLEPIWSLETLAQHQMNFSTGILGVFLHSEPVNYELNEEQKIDRLKKKKKSWELSR